MPSLVQDIIGQLKTQLEAELTDYVEAFYKYDLARNSFSNNVKIYSIIPSNSSTVTGTNRTVTLDHEIIVRLCTEFVNKEDTDDAQEQAVFDLYEAHESLYRIFYGRPLTGISRTINVQEISIDAPEINEDDSIVILQARYRIIYRTE